MNGFSYLAIAAFVSARCAAVRCAAVRCAAVRSAGLVLPAVSMRSFAALLLLPCVVLGRNGARAIATVGPRAAVLGVLPTFSVPETASPLQRFQRPSDDGHLFDPASRHSSDLLFGTKDTSGHQIDAAPLRLYWRVGSIWQGDRFRMTRWTGKVSG